MLLTTSKFSFSLKFLPNLLELYFYPLISFYISETHSKAFKPMNSKPKNYTASAAPNFLATQKAHVIESYNRNFFTQYNLFLFCFTYKIGLTVYNLCTLSRNNKFFKVRILRCESLATNYRTASATTSVKLSVLPTKLPKVIIETGHQLQDSLRYYLCQAFRPTHQTT